MTDPLSSKTVNLPTWDECRKAVEGGYATHLQTFIYNNEPTDTGIEGFQTEGDFRKQLALLVEYERQPMPAPETKAEHYSVGDVDLAPCPFCASTDFDLTHRPDPSPQSYPDGVWVIECGGCGALGPFCEERDNAPKAWNDCKRRAEKTEGKL